VFLGRPHASSDVHDLVIASLERRGGQAPELEALRCAAERARDAVYAGDLPALGRAMIENTDAQRDLHPDLVGTAAQTVIEIARALGASGWKVNGAGGEGGSVTLLADSDRAAKRCMLRAIEAAHPEYRNIPIRLNRRGLCVWEM